MSKSKKSTSKKPSTVSTVPVPTPAASVASATPIPTNISAPPEGWVVPSRLGKKGRRPKHGLTLAATDLAGELRKNASAIFQELGPKAVDPAQLADALDAAYAWHGVEAKASTFHVYARAQRGGAWDHAVNLLTSMKLGVRFAVARDASFADRFPEVAKAFAPTRRPKPAAATGTPATPKATKSKAKAKSTPVAEEPAVAPPAPATPAETPAPTA